TLFVFALVEFGIKLFDGLGTRPTKSDPARHCDPHRPVHRDIGRRSRHRVAGTSNRFMLGRRKTPLGQIGKLKIVEEHVEEFLAGQHETKRILGIALAGIPGFTFAPTAARQKASFYELLVAGQPGVPNAPRAAVQPRLVAPVERDTHFAALEDIRNVTAPGTIANRPPDQRFGAPQESLAALHALPPPVPAAVPHL